MIVLPEGPRDAKIAIVGEAPGKDEEKEGKPFVGASGQMLNQLLAKNGVLRSQCYITNVMQTRPEGNDFGVFYLDAKRKVPSPALVAGWERLRGELQALRPNITLLLGAEPNRAVTGHHGIDDWRGSLTWVSGIGKVFPTYHPAYIFRKYEWRDILGFDLARALKERHTPDYTPPTPLIAIPQHIMEAEEWFHKLLQYKRLSFDIELWKNDIKHIICISFCGAAGEGVSFPLKSGQARKWKDSEYETIYSGIKALLESRHSEKIGQNATFDTFTIGALMGIQTQRLVWDTMLMSHLVYPFFPKDLGFLTSLYTPYSCYWKERDFGAGGTDALFKYNAMDSIVAFECVEPLIEELKECGMFEYYTRYLQPLILPVAQMQDRGILISKSKQEELQVLFKARMKELLAKVSGVAGEDINPRSTKQMQHLLFDKLKLPVKYKKGHVTTDQDALNALYAKFPKVECLEWIKEYRSLGTILSNHLSIRVDKDCKARCSFNLAKVYTGRLASSRAMFGSGTNLMNIPKREYPEVREMFLADPGYIMLSLDLKQADARVVALISRCRDLLAAFAAGVDIHTFNASLIYGMPEKDVTKKRRYLAKRIVHASNYGMRPKKMVEVALKDGFPITIQEAQDGQEKYFVRFPEIVRWQAEVWKTLKDTRTLRTLFGRRVRFLGRLNDEGGDTHRDALAFVPQGTVGEVINIGLTRANALIGDKFKLLLQVHDELVGLVRPQDLDYVIKELHTCFDIPITYRENTIVIPIEVKVGTNFGQLKEVEGA